MKKIIIIFLISLLLVTGCGKYGKNDSSQDVIFNFYKENFLLQNFDVAKELTKDIPKEKLEAEANKINNKLRENYINKFSIAYRKVSDKGGDSKQIQYQLFSFDFGQLVNINLIKSNERWKVNKFTTKFFTDPDKMVDFLNSHEWKEKQLTNRKNTDD